MVLGGARSGKSRRAATLAESSGLAPLLVATATAGDAEMAARIEQHRHDRGPNWTTIEEPVDLVGVLTSNGDPARILVVDCLTLWLSNLMFAGLECGPAVDSLVHAVASTKGPCIFVTNEVGQGIVPDNAMARDFRDHQGRLNQKLAAACDTVELVVAGIPLRIKP